ncbi:MlaE family lipid ABC transporter permease subunit [bacterium]|nr:MlaE family lipid ABC transporter permease subunit [bacterium]
MKETQITWTGMDLAIEGELTIPMVSLVLKQAGQLLELHAQPDLSVDLSRVEKIDTAGVVLLETLKNSAAAKNIRLHWTRIPAFVDQAMTTFSGKKDSKGTPGPPREASVLARMGNFAYDVGHHLHDLFYLIADTFYYSVQNLTKRHGQRKGEFTNQLVLIGMNAFPIVGLVSFLIGLILALQSAAQLRQFGAAIYVADLIAISMTREMGPIMTAIMLAGRSGSAITSEIATMVVTEETDALKSMALNPVQYVLVPKFYAMTVAMPLLTILSVIIGILGAFVIGLTYLEIGLEPFYNQVVSALFLKDIITGLVKSVVFAWLIVILGAYHGFRVRGGAAEVGKATTASVVSSIFAVIFADSILGLIFYLGQTIDI